MFGSIEGVIGHGFGSEASSEGRRRIEEESGDELEGKGKRRRRKRARRGERFAIDEIDFARVLMWRKNGGIGKGK